MGAWPPLMPVLVRVRTLAGRDRLGNERYELGDPITVDGCLWSPGTPAELANTRPEGVKVTYTVHFPRGWGKKLRGAVVSVDGGSEWLPVIGDPREFPALPNDSLCCAVSLGGIDG